MAEVIENLVFRKDIHGTIRCQCGEYELTFKQRTGLIQSQDDLLIKHAKTHSATTVALVDVP